MIGQRSRGARFGNGQQRGLRLAAFLIVFALFAGALGTAKAQDATPATDTGLPSYIQLQPGETLAEKQELIVGVNRNLVNGQEDFWFAHSNLQVWEPLIRYNDNFELEPGLATSWELSADGLVWTFRLRTDAVFSNGTPFNSTAVLANVAHAKASSLRPSLFLGGINFPEIYGDPVVAAVDDYTVTFTYTQPRPLLPYAIANHYSAQFEPNQFDENSNFTGLPIGSGKFKLVDWQRDQYAVLERNENYYGEKPTLTKITIKIYADANARLSALKSGEVDALAELGAVLPAQAGEISTDPNYVVAHYPTACNTYLLTNASKAPFNDVKVRQALNLAIGRDALVKDLLYGYGIPSKGLIIAANKTFFNDNPDEQVKYNPDEAKRLLDEATGGTGVTVELLFNPPGQNLLGWPYPLIATYLQAVLQPIGFNITLKQQEPAAVTDSLNQGNYEFAISNNCWSSGEPNYMIGRTVGSQSAIQGAQHGSYNNPEVDALLAQALVELDPAKQIALYKQIQAIALSEAALTPLFDQETIIAFRPWVRGLTQHIAYSPSFDTVYLVAH